MQLSNLTSRAHKPLRRAPTLAELEAIPLAVAGEFELTDKELGRMRRHIYAINRDGIRRYRTMRDHRIVLVWRIK